MIDRVPSLGDAAARVRQEMLDKRMNARVYMCQHGEDDPEISNWTWSALARTCGSWR